MATGLLVWSEKMVTSPVRPSSNFIAASQGNSQKQFQAQSQEQSQQQPHKSQFASGVQSFEGHGLTVPPLPDAPLFGTDGIRGTVGDVLTVSLALHIGYWAGCVFKTRFPEEGPVILGQDSRNSGDMLSAALAAGMTASGLTVWNLGLCPTPGVAFLAAQTEVIAGIMISASHNPPADNGIKFFGGDGTKLSKALQQDIETAIRTHAVDNPQWQPQRFGQTLYRPDLVDRYAAALEKTLAGGTDDTLLGGMKVILDPAWGATVNIAPAVFEEMGATVLTLHGRPNGDRINVNCGSTHLETLQAAVLEHNADLGFGFEGDADRVLAVDNQGRIVDGDYILYLWGLELKKAGQLPNQEIVATVMSNLGFERAWEAQGGTLIRTAVGDQHVHKAMVDRGSMLGGEQSGHLLCFHYGPSGDGTLSALHLAALVKRSGKTLAELVDASFKTYPQKLVNVRVECRDRRRHWQQCDALMQGINHAEQGMGDKGRVLVRASGTEPVIRVMVEASDAQMVDHWTSYLVAIVEEHLSS
ncbi:MAG: phosphoglucosamine mutase [Cyanophyceae cyanobacterium]